MAARIPLSSRPLDLFYFTFFLIHLPASLLLDCQALYPPNLAPSFIRELPKIYTQFSADPLISGIMGYTGESSNFLWLKTFLFVEIFFQVPVFIIGMRGLWKDSHSIYLLMLIYGASTATTTLPCLIVLLSTPIMGVQTIVASAQPITVTQYYLLLSSYLPFFLIPFIMTIDMASRIVKLLQVGVGADTAKKLQ